MSEDIKEIQTRRIAEFGWVAFALAHIPLAFLMNQFPEFSTVHALLVGLTGILVASSRRYSYRVIYVIAYIAGAEALWRMTDAMIFWEYGKYATVAIAGLALLNRRPFPKPGGMVWFFVLLLPSTAITLTSLSLSHARDQISFYLSGALSLSVCAWYLGGQQFTSTQIKRMFTFFIAPVYAIFALALSGALNAPTQSFLTGESSVLSSGGYGPNQVSSILGLGALLALFYLIILKPGPILGVFMFITLVVFLGQSALTLSRGGIYLFGLGALAALFFIFRERRLRFAILLLVLVFSLTIYFFLPRLDQFTAGGLTNRFTDTSTTGRMRFMLEEIQAWLTAPIFGVGPGMAAYFRQLHGVPFDVASHNEFSRLLAEHGAFGLLAILLLIYTAVRNFRQAALPAQRGLVAGLLAWSFACMAYTALRLVVPSVLFGLSGAILCAEQSQASVEAETSDQAEEPGLNLPKPTFPRKLTFHP